MDKKKILDLAEQANLTAHAPEGLGGDGYIDNEKEILEFARLLLGTTKASVAAHISEIRNDGYTIRSEQCVDTKGRVKSFYCLG